MEDQYEWLTEFLAEREKKMPSVINSLIPKFDRYFIVEWNRGIIDHFPFNEYPVNGSDIDDLNKQHTIKKEFGLFLNDKKTEHLYLPISIKDLATRFNVPYSIDTMDIIPHYPGISILHSKTIESLKALLSFLANGKSLNLYVSDNDRFSYEDPMDAKNRIDNVEEYLAFHEDTGFDSWSYLFPDGHEWCFTTIEWFSNFVFGCSNKIASQLHLVSALEFFEVNNDYPILEF